ncbi:hypothetical protein phiOC_p146 [Ochrobactrum phage vB_OspM_OC]|nr:hypothetical protein phiOC_p146 [Ochrobactrum phage vB_OspM_OC]
MPLEGCEIITTEELEKVLTECDYTKRKPVEESCWYALYLSRKYPSKSDI